MDSCNKLIPGTSNFWKLDKIDKIVIALWFICFAIFCIGDCFASENSLGVSVPVQFVDELAPDTNGNTFYKNVNCVVGYYSLEVGHTYTFYNFYGGNVTLRTTSEVPAVGVVYDNLSVVSSDSSYSFTVENNTYLYVSSFTSSDNPYEVLQTTRFLYDNTIGMSSSVDSLVQNVGQEQIWSIFDTGIPIALLVVLVAFGIFIIGFASRKIQKGKMGI